MNRSKTRSAEICRSPRGDKANFTQFGSELWTHGGADQNPPLSFGSGGFYGEFEKRMYLPQTNSIKEAPPITISVRLISYVDVGQMRVKRSR